MMFDLFADKYLSLAVSRAILFVMTSLMVCVQITIMKACAGQNIDGGR